MRQIAKSSFHYRRLCHRLLQLFCFFCARFLLQPSVLDSAPHGQVRISGSWLAYLRRTLGKGDWPI